MEETPPAGFARRVIPANGGYWQAFGVKKQARVACHPSCRHAPLRMLERGIFGHSPRGVTARSEPTLHAPSPPAPFPAATGGGGRHLSSCPACRKRENGRTTISLWRSTRGKEPSACKKGGPKPPFKIVGLCVCLPRPPGAGLQRDDRPMPESVQSLRPGVEHADAVGPKARRVPRVHELDEFGELAPVTGVAGF